MDKQRIEFFRLALLQTEDALRGFDFGRAPLWAHEACAMFLLMYCHDLAQGLDKVGRRIDFHDHCRDGKDITDEISGFRNGLCHIRSFHKEFHAPYSGPGNRLPFAVSTGGDGSVQIAGKEILCPYKDDILLQLGDLRLLVVRQISRFVQESRVIVIELSEQHNVTWPKLDRM